MAEERLNQELQDFTKEVLEGGVAETGAKIKLLKDKMKKKEVYDMQTAAWERKRAMDLVERTPKLDWADVEEDEEEEEKEREPTYAPTVPSAIDISEGTSVPDEDELNRGLVRMAVRLTMNEILSTMDEGKEGTVGGEINNLFKKEFKPIRDLMDSITKRFKIYEERLEKQESITKAAVEKMERIVTEFGHSAQEMRDAASDLKKKSAIESGKTTPSIATQVLADISDVATRVAAAIPDKKQSGSADKKFKFRI